MRMLNALTDEPVEGLQLYLTPEEAREFRASLDRLLSVPEAPEHEHVFSRDGGFELSFSIVTPEKLRTAHCYTPAERRLFGLK